MARLRRSIPVVLSVLAFGGCTSEGLAFRVDERVTITSPADRATVELPLRLVWKVRDFDCNFAVFVDQAPMRPGAPFAPQRGAYRTDETELVIDEVDPIADNGADRHTATIVLLGADGRRVGESAFAVDFEIKPEDAS